MFSDKIKCELEQLRESLAFDSMRFTEDPKDVLSEIENKQIVGYYSNDIELQLDTNKRGFAFIPFDVLLIMPEDYITDAVIWNVYSFSQSPILGISTDSNQIHQEIYQTKITSGYKLIRFKCQYQSPVDKLKCCLKMNEEC